MTEIHDIREMRFFLLFFCSSVTVSLLFLNLCIIPSWKLIPFSQFFVFFRVRIRNFHRLWDGKILVIQVVESHRNLTSAFNMILVFPAFAFFITMSLCLNCCFFCDHGLSSKY